MTYKTILVLFLITLSLVIFAQNTQVVSFKLLFWEITMSRIVMLLFTMIIGVVIGYIIAKVQRGKHE